MTSATLGICTHRDIKIRVHGVVWILRMSTDPKVTPIFQDGDALISRSRNRVATHFLKNTEDEMLVFLDDDVEIKPQDLLRMIDEVHTNRYPILGAPYVLKSHESGGFAFYTEDNKGTIHMGTGGGVVPVKRVSTGCMIILREVLEKMVKKETAHWCKQGYYTFFQHREIEEAGAWDDASEDWWFCAQAKKLGFQVFMDTRPKTNHWGQFPYNWDFVKLNGEFKKYDDLVMSYDLDSSPPSGK